MGLEVEWEDLFVEEVTVRIPPKGEDRITPGHTPAPIYVHHAKRYAFAQQFCQAKRVVDLGAGTGPDPRRSGVLKTKPRTGDPGGAFSCGLADTRPGPP